MKSDKPTILVIVGVTGDLSTRKLLPALQRLIDENATSQMSIIGTSRTPGSVDDILSKAKLRDNSIAKHVSLFTLQLAEYNDYILLRENVQRLNKEKYNNKAQVLVYLSIPPQVSKPVIEMLGKSGFGDAIKAKLLLEKPFGTDIESAKELVDFTNSYFTEDQVYRIDHYLAKEMVQNLIVFRADNSLIKRTWNKDFIEKIEIIASESIGIEGRAIFYEQTGALKDVVQSHLLQLAALTLMRTPSNQDISKVPELRLHALKQLSIDGQLHPDDSMRRAQYDGYQEEAQNPHSVVETFASLQLASSDPAWEGVPIYIKSGKAMKEKYTRIVITYKKDEQHEANILEFNIQPDEGVVLKIWTKVPGYNWQLENHKLHFAFKEHFSALPEAYEQVLLDAIRSNHTLFTTGQEVVESWRIVDTAQRHWEFMPSIASYSKGTDINEL